VVNAEAAQFVLKTDPSMVASNTQQTDRTRMTRRNVGASMRYGLVIAGFSMAGSALAQPLEGRLKTIHETALLRIAFRADSSPFSYLDATQQPTGYAIELCERIARSLEAQLKKTIQIKWVAVDTRTRFEAIVDGTADMECGSTTISLSRMKIVDFSSVIYADSTGILVRPGSGLFRFDSLAGRTIGVIAGSTNAHAVRDQLIRRKLNAKLIEFRDRAEGISALARGELDGFASDKLVLFSLAKSANLQGFSILPEDLSVEPFAIMLPRGDWAFRLAVNTGLARLFRGGDVIELHTKYFSGMGSSMWIGAVFVFGGLPE
jgi:glutamate/aspartate transport system substrate-binding protein